MRRSLPHEKRCVIANSRYKIQVADSMTSCAVAISSSDVRLTHAHKPQQAAPLESRHAGFG